MKKVKFRSIWLVIFVSTNFIRDRSILLICARKNERKNEGEE